MAPNQEETQALLEKGLVSPHTASGRRLPVVKVVTALALVVAAAVGVSYMTPQLTAEEKELQRLMKLDVGDEIERINHFGEAADSYGDLSLLVHRVGYSPVDLRARRLYGWDHIAEPFVENIIRVENIPDDGEEYTYSFKVEILEGPSLNDFSNVHMTEQGSSVEVTFPDASNRFRLHVVEYDSTGTMSREGFTETLVSKFVRREIRTLKDEDRNRYIEAVKLVYTMSQEEGEAKYGSRFVSHAHLAAQHDNSHAQYHVTVAFITSHPAMLLRLEQALLAIDSKLMTPYWDFLVDAKLEGNWVQADVYRLDWFGSIRNGPAVNYQIQGSMADVENVYDPDYALFPKAYHNAYGYLGIGYFKDLGLQRSNHFCNYEHRGGFSNCGRLAKCITNYMDGTYGGLYGFDHCMELNVHGTVHDMHAGMWDCNVDYSKAKEQYSDWLHDGLLSFHSINVVYCVQMLAAYGKESCETECSTEEKCTCSPSSETGIETIQDIDEQTEDETYDLVSLCTENLISHQYRGHVYLKYVGEDEGEDESTENYGKVVWRGLTTEQNDLMNKLFLKASMFPGVWGPFTSGAAPLDPLFFQLHQIFDKAMHLVRMAGEYKDVLDFTWMPLYHDKGIGWYSQTAFSGEYWEPYLGGHENLLRRDGKVKYLNNKEIWAMLKPDGKASPYVYSNVRSFGACEFADTDAVRSYAAEVPDIEMVYGDFEPPSSSFKSKSK